MERLTEKRDGQNVIPLRQDGKTKWALCSAGMGDADTKFLYGDHADKLAEYEDLEEQGKLLKLPCAVGDTVYRIKSRYTKCSVHNEKLGECIYKGCGAECDSRKEYFVDEKVVQNVGQIVNTMQTGNFGKAVFLTREEAEAALERRGANEQ